MIINQVSSLIYLMINHQTAATPSPSGGPRKLYPPEQVSGGLGGRVQVASSNHHWWINRVFGPRNLGIKPSPGTTTSQAAEPVFPRPKHSSVATSWLPTQVAPTDPWGCGHQLVQLVQPLGAQHLGTHQRYNLKRFSTRYSIQGSPPHGESAGIPTMTCPGLELPGRLLLNVWRAPWLPYKAPKWGPLFVLFHLFVFVSPLSLCI